MYVCVCAKGSEKCANNAICRNAFRQHQSQEELIRTLKIS